MPTTPTPSSVTYFLDGPLPRFAGGIFLVVASISLCDFNASNQLYLFFSQWATRRMELYLLSVTQLAGLGSSLTIENRLFGASCKKYQQMNTNEIKDT